MSEEILVRQGAPTLAGIKTGSLFPCPCEDKEALFADIRRLNRLLVPKGLCLLPIRFLKGQVLLYLYRPSELRRDLENEQAAEILHHAGYNSGHCGRCIANLIRRFREGGEFPHEVGLFLSYPPEDVKGFIDHRACNFKCAGLWKVYGDEKKARELFEAGVYVNPVLPPATQPGNCLLRTSYMATLTTELIDEALDIFEKVLKK